MPPSTKKKKALNDMSIEELSKLEDGFITIRDYVDHQIEAILEEIQDRLEKNLIK
jgi:ribosomal silencing factor RsfS